MFVHTQLGFPCPYYAWTMIIGPDTYTCTMYKHCIHVQCISIALQSQIQHNIVDIEHAAALKEQLNSFNAVLSLVSWNQTTHWIQLTSPDKRHVLCLFAQDVS